MANATKHWPNLKDRPFTTFVDHWEANCPTKKVSVSDMQNLKSLSKHTEVRWRVFSLDRDNITEQNQMEFS